MKTQLFYNNIEDKILINLCKAKQSVKIAMAWFTNPKIFKVLFNLINEGIEIEIILSNDHLNFTNNKINFQKFIDEGCVLRINQSNKLMHNKFCIIDDRLVMNGSYNWTIKAEKLNFENMIISVDLALVNDFNEYFQILKEKTFIAKSISQIEYAEFLSESERKTELEFVYEKLKQLDLEIIKGDAPPRDEDEDEDKNKEQNEIAWMKYINMNHRECIEYCNELLNSYPQSNKLEYIKALAYWRLGKYKEMIKSASKVISTNNLFYDAYNLLGIGYSKLKNEQKSIHNFTICIKENSEEHVYYRNRALSYMELEDEPNLPTKIREKYKHKADKDLNKIIKIVNSIDKNKINFDDYHSLAFAYLYMRKYTLANSTIKKAIQAYNDEKNELIKDKNELKSIKLLLKEIKANL